MHAHASSKPESKIKTIDKTPWGTRYSSPGRLVFWNDRNEATGLPPLADARGNTALPWLHEVSCWKFFLDDTVLTKIRSPATLQAPMGSAEALHRYTFVADSLLKTARVLGATQVRYLS